MIVIPAIDLKGGQVVRLKQGDFDQVTEYSSDPASMARSFAEAKAKRIHVVDLDGSIEGRSSNYAAIKAICESVTAPVEVGGGVRSLADAQALFDAGVSYIILGTMVVKDPAAARAIIEAFPGKVGLGVDAKDGLAAIHGWKEVTDKPAVELIKSYEASKPAFVVYTDISRDGMLGGPNFEATAKLAAATSIPVVASGGVASLGDLIELQHIPGLLGAITGKALYEGRIELKQAIATIEKED